MGERVKLKLLPDANIKWTSQITERESPERNTSRIIFFTIDNLQLHFYKIIQFWQFTLITIIKFEVFFSSKSSRMNSKLYLVLSLAVFATVFISSSHAGVIPSWLKKGKNSDSPKTEKELSCQCPSRSEPICGNDRITYLNACQFKCAMSKKKGTYLY